MAPLDGVRVLDFTRHLPGPYATDLLRQLGARVIKIEPPDGDPTRWLPPFAGDYGALFGLVNSGKESVVVDLKSDDGPAFVRQLVPHCDVVVESYRPGVAKSFGIDAGSLLAIRADLVYCSISGFGAENSRSSHDLNFVALAGMLDLQRDANGRPVLPSTQIGDMGGALFAALAIVAAVLERRTTGKGRVLDISMADATRALMPTAEALYRGTHHTPKSFMLTGALPNYDIYETSDGKYISVASLEPHFWKAFCEAIGHRELTEQQYEPSQQQHIRETVAATIRTRNRDEWESIFRNVDACVEPVLSIEEAHERFGDPMARQPLQTNFPAEPAGVPKLGDAFDDAASIAGIEHARAKKMRKSPVFTARDGMMRLITKTAIKLRHKQLTGK